nr:hypothetical protein [Rhodoferax sp.]
MTALVAITRKHRAPKGRQCLPPSDGKPHARGSLYFMVYNFVKIHKTIKTTPAMEAGVSTNLLSMEDIVMMSETAA